MKRVSELVGAKLVNKELKNKLTSSDIQIRALGIAGELASITEPDDMTAWYCKAYIELGEGKYMMIANMARKGKKPKQLFGWLLKQEMAKK